MTRVDAMDRFLAGARDASRRGDDRECMGLTIQAVRHRLEPNDELRLALERISETELTAWRKNHGGGV